MNFGNGRIMRGMRFARRHPKMAGAMGAMGAYGTYGQLRHGHPLGAAPFNQRMMGRGGGRSSGSRGLRGRSSGGML